MTEASASIRREIEPPLIEARGLSKAYGPIVAVRDLSFEVARGEILGLLGPNGAGKSTTLRMLIGFQYPDAGTVRLNGHDVFREGIAARTGLGYLPEILPLYVELSVGEYLEYFAALKRVTNPSAALDRVLSELDLGPVRDRPCGNLSRGYRQRVGLAQALLSEPAILILDEPTAGLDPNQIQDFRRLIRRLGRDRAILLSTHILPEALEICDRVLILSKGSAVASGNPQSLGTEEHALHWARFRCATAPTSTDLARFHLRPEPQDGCYRLEEDLPREAARALLRHAADSGWEVLEWHVGAAGLESAFRRLTLGEEVS